MNSTTTQTPRLAPMAVAFAPAIDRDLLQRHVRDLPPLPQAALCALATLRREGATAADCAVDIEHDPALTARTLRLANSAFYGVPGRVATVRDAVHLLGRRTLAGVLTTAVVSSQFGHVDGFDSTAFWQHALAAAIAAQTLAAGTSLDDELAFTAGLLHDIGRLALAIGFPNELAQAMRLAGPGDSAAIDAEHLALGTTHAEVGAMIARHWRFPDAVAQAIAGHHSPGPGHPPLLADLVHAGDAIAHALDLNGDPGATAPPLDADAWQRLGLPSTAWLHALERTRAAVSALSEALGVGT